MIQEADADQLQLRAILSPLAIELYGLDELHDLTGQNVNDNTYIMVVL